VSSNTLRVLADVVAFRGGFGRRQHVGALALRRSRLSQTPTRLGRAGAYDSHRGGGEGGVGGGGQRGVAGVQVGEVRKLFICGADRDLKWDLRSLREWRGGEEVGLLGGEGGEQEGV